MASSIDRNGKIRVLVVDDSALMRQMLSDILKSDPRIEVVGTARDGVEALAKIGELKPNIVTLDVEMPNMGGLEVLERIMKTAPLPVIMVSSLTQEDAEITMKALALGCVDFVGKPSGAISLNIRSVGSELIEKVVAASTASVRSLVRGAGVMRPQLRTLLDSLATAPQAPRPSVRRREIVAIASSTGGPMALSELIPKLPGNFPVPIVVTQHMPPGFTASFAKRLDGTSALKVTEGADGLELRPGMVVIAPGGSHLIFRRRNGAVVCELLDAPPVLSVKPAANIMFMSVADEFGGNAVCVVLTGMGRDGTDGATILHRKGAWVIAESQKTCVVYGMPKAVAEAGIVDEVLPLNEIPDALIRAVK